MGHRQSGGGDDDTFVLKIGGDGTVNGTEACDLGLFANVGEYGGCNMNCTLAPFCGDSAIGGPEECDNGASNNDTTYAGCSLTCHLNAYCGDMTVNGPEICDDGRNISSYRDALSPNACAPMCVLPPYCGDAHVDPMFGETCDLGTANNTGAVGGCKPDCTRAQACGDGNVDAGEQCDDGNTVDFDACTNACNPARCGDGITGPGEQCDDGNQANNDTCTNACQNARCGDTIVTALGAAIHPARGTRVPGLDQGCCRILQTGARPCDGVEAAIVLIGRAIDQVVRNPVPLVPGTVVVFLRVAGQGRGVVGLGGLRGYFLRDRVRRAHGRRVGGGATPPNRGDLLGVDADGTQARLGDAERDPGFENPLDE